MQIKFFLLISLFFTFSAGASDWKTNKLVNGCRIFNIAGYMERAFPGSMCLFLDNGNLISASESGIRMINPKNDVVWEFKGSFHHQINFSHDKTKILALASEIHNDLREDVFYIFDLEGKVLALRKSSELYQLKKIPSLGWKMAPLTINGLTSNRELSHFNSIYDIPVLNKKGLPSWLRTGNIILNTSASGIFILSPDLKDILHHVVLEGSMGHRIHDVQIKPNGNFLIFNNLVSMGPPTRYYLMGLERTMHHSAIQELNPESLKVVSEFSTSPKPSFYSWICGSIQELDEDTWLFTHFLTGTYIYSKSKKDYIASIPGTHADNERFGPVQQVKSIDLTKFLSFWP